jgi:uncharacterized membrane protein HdeD (DUF308 family)
VNALEALDIRVRAEIIHNWGWFLAFSIGLVVLGAAAVVRSVAATVVSMLFFGWLLVIAAGIELAQTIMVGRWAGMFPHMIGAVLFAVVGTLIIWRPVVTAEILTLLGSRLIKSTIQGRQQETQRRDSCGPICHSGWQCV